MFRSDRLDTIGLIDGMPSENVWPTYHSKKTVGPGSHTPLYLNSESALLPPSCQWWTAGPGTALGPPLLQRGRMTGPGAVSDILLA